MVERGTSEDVPIRLSGSPAYAQLQLGVHGHAPGRRLPWLEPSRSVLHPVHCECSGTRDRRPHQGEPDEDQSDCRSDHPHGSDRRNIPDFDLGGSNGSFN